MATAGTPMPEFASVALGTPAEVSTSCGVNIKSAADAPAFSAFSTCSVSVHGPAWTSAMSPLGKAANAASEHPPKPSKPGVTATGVTRAVTEPDGE